MRTGNAPLIGVAVAVCLLAGCDTIEDMASAQQWTLIYLGLSSLGFVLVWLVGYLRR